jgi:hypothetical protein
VYGAVKAISTSSCPIHVTAGNAFLLSPFFNLSLSRFFSSPLSYSYQSDVASLTTPVNSVPSRYRPCTFLKWTTCLLKAYPTEKLTVLCTGMKLSGDDNNNGIEVPIDPVTNLPTP